MKRAVLFFGFMLSIQLSAQTDLVKNDLRGQVKSLEESKMKAMIRVNQIENYQQEYQKKIDYNTDGFITTESFFDEDHLPTYKVVYTYNNDGELISKDMDSYNYFLKIDEKFTYNSNEQKILTTENEVPVLEKTLIFDSNKNLIEDKSKNLEEEGIFVNEKNEYNSANQLIKKVVNYDNGDYEIYYKYNDKGFLIEEETKNGNELISKKVRLYNTQGDLIAEKMFDGDSKQKYSVEIKYEYDQQNNWIKRTQYHNKLDQPVSNTVRKISYY